MLKLIQIFCDDENKVNTEGIENTLGYFLKDNKLSLNLSGDNVYDLKQAKSRSLNPIYPGIYGRQPWMMD